MPELLGTCEICGYNVYDDEAHIIRTGDDGSDVYTCEVCMEEMFAEPDYDDDFPMYLEYDDWQYDHLDTGDDWW